MTQSGHQHSARAVSRSYRRYAAWFAFASKRARAFFPSLAATAMLSKKTGELSSGFPPTGAINLPLPCPRRVASQRVASQLHDDRIVGWVKFLIMHARINGVGRLKFQQSPLLGVKRTCRLHCEMSAFDPKRTFLAIDNHVLRTPCPSWRRSRVIKTLFGSGMELLADYVSDWAFQTRTATAGLSNVEGAFVRLATSRNFVARTGSRFAD